MSSNAIRRILVAVKYPRAEIPNSAFKAAQIARGLHADLCLFHAIDQPLCAEDCPGDGGKSLEDERRIREHLLSDLSRHASALKTEASSVTVGAEWDYPAHEAVLRQGQRIGADLIVTERHLPGALHSADWELLRLSLKPVLIVKDDDEDALYRQPVIIAAIDPLHRHAKPAGLDKDICMLAQEFSSALGGSWCAVHAYATGSHGLLQRPRPTSSLEEPHRAEALKAVTQMLQAVALTPRTVQLRDNAPAEAIVESTREWGASLLVMGALSRSGLEGMLIGNTAEQVIDQVSCDVLIVKPDHFGIHFSPHVQGARRLPKPPAKVYI